MLLFASIVNSNRIQEEVDSLKETIQEVLSNEFPVKALYDTVSVCSQPEDILAIHYIKLTPDPPQKGQELRVQGSGYFKETVGEGGYVDVVVKYGIVTIYSKRLDLCEQAPEVDESCPVMKGNHTIDKVAQLPGNIFPGSYNIYVNAYNADNKQIACLSGHASFGL
ncbi:15483_t:CDS:2 [Entrophospora sp. SA101]|nr:1648_t:CDS:2 [Entrophospora sp. SA101]CAJ0631067.1 8521_t:CDS:2 [Entrophospora sp. SA101]CAJ0753956.1 15483_t:CDS:2 [Entrophospora sp. SA101]CAJ0828130.1 6484_t:CDS:2 [Entrophospora sp. SA101]CAJ0901695.1 6519_t:CDS:2 [Entrophospora sp. SA101]